MSRSNMKTVSSHVLKLLGKAELPKEIEMGHNYHVSLSGSIPKVEEHDNEDGTITRIYTFKPVKLELLDPLGETLQLKDTRTRSQIFRARLWSIWKSDSRQARSFDEEYDALMSNLIDAAPDVWEMFRQKPML